jgi:PleD family two-component response regulator
MISQASQRAVSGLEQTSRDDNKTIVSDILKRVDQLIKKGDLERAQAEIVHAKEVDSRNVYTLALEERILSLKNSLPLKMTPPPAPAETVSAEDKQKADAQNNKLAPTQEEISMYQAALKEAWKTGILDSDEEIQLRELRAVLNIQEIDHAILEKQVKMDLLKKSPAGKSTTSNIPEKEKPLEEKSGKILMHEPQKKIQEQYVSPLQSRRKKEQILVIDDDARLLELLALSLEDSGYEVIALTTSDEAFALLRKFVPDLILCDINLETSTMGGFTFYERLQELKNVQNVPFIFLTGLTDEALVRTGKELGVDDYLMKPISEKTLLSTIRGKLKRFRQIRKAIAVQASA